MKQLIIQGAYRFPFYAGAVALSGYVGLAAIMLIDRVITFYVARSYFRNNPDGYVKVWEDIHG